MPRYRRICGEVGGTDSLVVMVAPRWLFRFQAVGCVHGSLTLVPLVFALVTCFCSDHAIRLALSEGLL